MNTERHRFLRAAAVLVPAGLALPVLARAQSAPACADPATLPLSQKRKRRALEYADPSNLQGKACGTCAFFTASTPGCGACTLLGGPVAATAVCASFAPRS